MKFILINILIIALTLNVITSIRNMRQHSRAKTYSYQEKVSKKSYLKVQGLDQSSKSELIEFIKKYIKFIGVTFEEVGLIADTLNKGDYVLFRPVNPGIRKDIKNQIAVGKGMNIHGKSSNLAPIQGMVPFLQEMSKASNANKEGIKSANEANKHSLEEGEKKKNEIEKYKTCSVKYLEDKQMIVGKKSLNIPEQFHASIKAKYPEYNGEDIELMGYHQFDPATCKSIDIKFVVADYDILVIGNCNNQAEDSVMKSTEFQTIYDLAKQNYHSSDAGVGAELNEKVFQLNHKTNPTYIKNQQAHNDIGFAPAQTMKLILQIINKVIVTGVVRHSAEIYNYVFVQKFTTEPHLFIQKLNDGKYKVDIIFVHAKETSDSDIAITEVIQEGKEDGGAQVQFAMINYLKKLAQTCKCVPINLLWTQEQDATKPGSGEQKLFQHEKWKEFFEGYKQTLKGFGPKDAGSCPLYDITL